MTEKHMQTFFGKYLKQNLPPQAEVYELKFTKKNSIPFNAVDTHQIEALLKARTGGLYHKIQDFPTSWGMQTGMRYTSKKPFDCFVLANTPAFVVIWFYKPRGKKMFVKIPIRNFLAESKISIRKSLTEERASEIGEMIEINL